MIKGTVRSTTMIEGQKAKKAMSIEANGIIMNFDYIRLLNVAFG